MRVLIAAFMDGDYTMAGGKSHSAHALRLSFLKCVNFSYRPLIPLPFSLILSRRPMHDVSRGVFWENLYRPQQIRSEVSETVLIRTTRN